MLNHFFCNLVEITRFSIVSPHFDQLFWRSILSSNSYRRFFCDQFDRLNSYLSWFCWRDWNPSIFHCESSLKFLNMGLMRRILKYSKSRTLLIWVWHYLVHYAQRNPFWGQFWWKTWFHSKTVGNLRFLIFTLCSFQRRPDGNFLSITWPIRRFTR